MPATVYQDITIDLTSILFSQLHNESGKVDILFCLTDERGEIMKVIRNQRPCNSISLWSLGYYSMSQDKI